MLDLAVSVASGTMFLGHYPVSNPGPVIIVQQEDFHGQVVERLATIMFSRLGIAQFKPGDTEQIEIQTFPSLPIYVHPHRQLRFDDESIVQFFSNVVRRIRPALVVIDPLYSTSSTDDYLASAAERMFVLKALRDHYGTSFLIAHHTKKSEVEGSDRRLQIWGSQFLNAFLETGWQIRKGTSESRVEIHRHFKVVKNPEPISMEFDISTKLGEEPRYQISINPTDTNRDITLRFIEDKPRSLADVAKLLGVHHNSAKRLLDKLAEEGEVKRRDDKRYEIIGSQLDLEDQIG
jgi:hypothetical protein